jgi:hypothetical protein
VPKCGVNEVCPPPDPQIVIAMQNCRSSVGLYGLAVGMHVPAQNLTCSLFTISRRKYLRQEALAVAQLPACRPAVGSFELAFSPSSGCQSSEK